MKHKMGGLPDSSRWTLGGSQRKKHHFFMISYVIIASLLVKMIIDNWSKVPGPPVYQFPHCLQSAVSAINHHKWKCHRDDNLYMFEVGFEAWSSASIGDYVRPSVGPLVRPSVGWWVPISLWKLIMSRLLREEEKEEEISWCRKLVKSKLLRAW
jgi:hypothetical protein